MNHLLTEYPRLVEEQKKVSPELPEWDETPPFVEAIQLLSQNLSDTVKFIENDCTPEQLVWMSVIASSVAKNLKNKDFTDAMRKAATKFSDKIEGYNVIECIDEAEGIINDKTSKTETN